jgi:HAD superfamily phosphoserine phosphatase-like hydrolase
MSNSSVIELVVLDLDGTTTEGNSWQKLNFAMGVTKAEDNYFYDLYAAHKISYQQWLDALLALYNLRSDPTRESILIQLLKYKYIPGARETIAEIQQAGYHLAIISGSMDMFVGAVAEDLQVDRFAYNTTLHFDACGKLYKAEAGGEDNEVKLEQLKIICNERKISLEQCVCVGDSDNDRLLFRATGRGITFEHCKLIHDCAWMVVKDWYDVPSLLKAV